MSVDGKRTGAFDQMPIGSFNAPPPHEFAASAAHDRDCFRIFTSWLMADSANVGNWPNELWEIKPPIVRGNIGYIKSTFTNPRPMAAGIYGMVINRQNELNGTDPTLDISDSFFSVWLYGSNGQRIRITAPDFAAGYTTLPTGILQQQSNAIPDGSGGFTVSPFFWVLPNSGATSTVPGSAPLWYYVVDTRLLFGNSTTFWPQVIRPIFGRWSSNDAGSPTMNEVFTTDINFFSLNVTFNGGRNAWVSLGNDVYPPVVTPLSPGFPSRYLATSGFLNGGFK